MSSQRFGKTPPPYLPLPGARAGVGASVRLRVEIQVSAGGVVYREDHGVLQAALISVGAPVRWQLPKGTVERGETNEQAALREVQEETGLEGEILRPLDTIEYWYQGRSDGGRVRYHKYVHFFLVHHLGGDLSLHDGEVNEARWVPMSEAIARLAFANERKVLEQAYALVSAAPGAR